MVTITVPTVFEFVSTYVTNSRPRCIKKAHANL